jgi:hypothetical protein
VGQRLLVAFDAGSVSGGLFSAGLGSWRVRAFVQAPLSPGALLPSPVADNLARRQEIQDALAAVLRGLGANRPPALLLLPDGVARLALLQPTRGVAPLEFARFRMGASLPFPAAEALFDVLGVGGGVFLGAAVRRSVGEGYESLADEAGLGRERIDLSGLASLAALLARSRGTEVEVILGDAAFSVAVVNRGALLAFRTRLRDRGDDEAERLAEEITRTLGLVPGSSPARIVVVGPGAPALVESLRWSGRPAEPGWHFSPEGLPLLRVVEGVLVRCSCDAERLCAY